MRELFSGQFKAVLYNTDIRRRRRRRKEEKRKKKMLNNFKRTTRDYSNLANQRAVQRMLHRDRAGIKRMLNDPKLCCSDRTKQALVYQVEQLSRMLRANYLELASTK